MSIQSFSINFAESLLPVNCGIPESVLQGISSRYIIKITAKLGTALLEQFNRSVGAVPIGPGGNREFTINGFLQDKISFSANSTWEGVTEGLPGNIGGFLKSIDTGAQAFFGRTAISTLSTRRKWAGSSPISLNLKLKFEAFSDPYREVILPCIGLQGLMLPRGGVANTIGLIPPGPNPFDLSLKGEQGTERGENISVDIGSRFLYFNSVIVKDVKVVMENRMSKSGPIGAEVDMTIETYQMLTREDLFKTIGTTMEKSSGVFGQTSL